MRGPNSRQKKLLLAIGLALGLLSLGFIYIKWPLRATHAQRSGAQPFFFTGARTYLDLRQLMNDGLQKDYSLLNDSLQRKESADDRTMDRLSTIAGRIDNLARESGSYEPDYRKQGRSPEDLALFREQSVLLGHAARDLQEAALRRQTDKVNAAFKSMGMTCANCHVRFGKKAVNVP